MFNMYIDKLFQANQVQTHNCYIMGNVLPI